MSIEESEPAHGYVYLITNTVNGKVYVGQTTGSVEERWKQHVLASGRINYRLYYAIRKYGADKFCLETIAACSDQASLDKTEDLYILISQGLRQDKGYNLKRGGRTGKLSEETCRKMSAAHKGKPKSEAHRLAMEPVWEARRQNPVSMSGENNPFYGRKHSPETLAKMCGREFSVEHRKNIGLAHAGEKGGRYRHDVSTPVMVALYLSGIGTHTIAKLVSMDSSSVWHRLKKEGVLRTRAQ